MKKVRIILSNENDIHVKIGEIKVGRHGDILKATLGSCVGIAFIWREKNRFGLAHCLLPEAHEVSTILTGKFVSQAIPSLMILLKVQAEDIKEIEVYIAGGGNMMSQLARKNVDHVGTLNLMAARKYLKEKGFKFKELDSGGDVGRQIVVDCASGEVIVHRFDKSA